ncbi:MAG: PD-(D/E)XK nuclease family protein [Acidobacteria bacterium]|nr:PD-(D/E)XK nuclease family protein [Acidobacteriota bacterium]
MGRRIVSSVSALARLECASDWLTANARRGGVLVAPTRGAGDDLARQLAANGVDFFGLHRTTPRLLAIEMATPGLAAAGRLPVAGLSLEALAARAASAAAVRLDHLSAVAGYPGFPRALARTLNELGGAGVSPNELEALGPACRDLVELWTDYIGEMDRVRHWESDQLAFADRTMVWEAAAGAADTGHPLAGLPLLFLDVAPATPAEGSFWRALAALSPDLLATVPGGDPGRAALADALDSAVVSLDDRISEQPTRLDALRRQVFSRTTEIAVEEDDGSLEIIAAPGEGREAVEIARRAHELALAGTPFDEMAVLLREPASYLGLVEEALERAGIPAWFTRGTVRPDPAGRALLTLLRCADEGLTASRFAEYLSLGQVPSQPAPEREDVEVPWVEPDGDQLVFKTLLTRPASRTTADADSSHTEVQADDAVVSGTLRAPRHWERLLVDAAVVGGRDRWARRLSGLQAEFEKRSADLDDGDEGTREHLARQMDDLAALERYALPLIDRLAQLPSRATWGTWIRELRALAMSAVRRPTRVIAVLGELEPMDKVDEVGLGEVIRVLEERLTELRAEPEGHRYGKIFVATIDEARGRVFDTVFLPGLAEGKFPRRVAEDPLLLDTLRERIDAPLETRDDRAASERLLLRIAAGAARTRLVVSYPTLDSLQGRARVPSFYALDIVRAAEGVLPNSEGLESRVRDRADALMGWPAPSDHLLAIDDAEFDISYLQRVLARATPADRGRARFLLARNEHLARSLRTRYLRWGKTFSGADGIVTPTPGGERALQAHRLRERSYSPTALQNFAACPYKFALSAIHRLRPRDEIASLERMDPLTRGSLFHDVQYELHCALRDAQLLPVTVDNLSEVTELGDTVLDRVSDDYRDRLAPAIERVWRDEVEGLRTDLRAWIRAVAESEVDWIPTYFEFSFGLGAQANRDPLSHHDEAVVFDGYRLRGSIDLVETNADDGSIRVTDHKTGKAAWKQRLIVDGGEILQPLLYALAAEHHLDGHVVGGRLFYCTRRGRFETREVELTPDNRRTVERVLDLIDNEIDRGFLPAAPKPLRGYGNHGAVCKWCDFRPVCGPYEATRVANKDQSQLNRLNWLREQS